MCSVICVISVSGGSDTTPFILSALNAGGLALAYKQIGDFWSEKGKVPMAESYNDGIRSSQQLHQILGGLLISWAVSAAIYLYRTIAYY